MDPWGWKQGFVDIVDADIVFNTVLNIDIDAEDNSTSKVVKNVKSVNNVMYKPLEEADAEQKYENIELKHALAANIIQSHQRGRRARKNHFAVVVEAV